MTARKNNTPNVIVLNEIDNVATATKQISPGEKIALGSHGSLPDHLSLEYIDTGHKISLVSIRKGDAIVKFGEIIGEATQDIRPGEHVHSHNMRSLHGRAQKESR